MDKPVTVYNFQVEDFHTYHVGNVGVLVHNAGEGYSGKKADILRENKEKGESFEKAELSKVKATHPEAETQVSIKPNDGGGRIRADAIALDKNGKPFISEFKASQKAPYTPNQKAQTYQDGIFKSGGKVVGRGKGLFGPGYEIPPGTPINTIRGV